MKLLLATVFSFIFINIFAAKVDTVAIYSPKMDTSMRCVVIQPESKDPDKRFPTVYLLHGYSGCYADWVTKVSAIKELADMYQMIIVCPNGRNSWYLDSPIDAKYQFETYIIKDVVSYIDTHYPTIADKTKRVITGLSMGGHGALYLALRHPDIFGACGSMSGGVDLQASKVKYEIANRMGPYKSNKKLWQSNTIVNIVDTITSFPPMIIDCGIADYFYNAHKLLHKKLMAKKAPHTFLEMPGEHNWFYWSNAIRFQLLFFDNFFGKG
jgi:S-formylglutathione hydrolase FrmB